MSVNRVPVFIKRLSRLIPDRLYIQLRYFSRFHKFCRLRKPVTYNEKLQWLKINYRIADGWKLVDKQEVKAFVAQLIGEKYVIPTLAMYDSVDRLNFDELPDSFVLKCTHDSGGVVLVENKKDVDIDVVREKLRYTMSRNYFYSCREPHYLGIRPRIIVEPLLKDERHAQLLDYKFFCFDGEVKALYLVSDRASGEVKLDYFDTDFMPLDIRQSYPNSSVRPPKPELFEEMLALARRLSEGHPHVRVDLYEIKGQVYFGELTFYHMGGFEPFHPEVWDQTFGDWLSLPTPIGNNQ